MTAVWVIEKDCRDDSDFLAEVRRRISTTMVDPVPRREGGFASGRVAFATAPPPSEPQTTPEATRPNPRFHMNLWTSDRFLLLSWRVGHGTPVALFGNRCVSRRASTRRRFAGAPGETR